MRKGYSLIEVILAIFMISVLVGIASFTFMGLPPKYQLKKALWEIHAQLNYARFKAILYETPFRMKTTSSGYEVEKYEANLNAWVLDRFGFFEGVTLQANNTPTFHPQGTVSHLASIYLSNSWGRYKITLAITGRIKIILL
jgi:prepilin-type N-terminal cleavage/methylation domain-containing protein